jgi:hypothetical protein
MYDYILSRTVVLRHEMGYNFINVGENMTMEVYEG